MLTALLAAAQCAIFVSAAGDDHSDALSHATAVRSLEVARDIARSSSRRVICLAPGLYSIVRAVALDGRDDGETWQGQEGATIDGRNASPAAFRAAGVSGVTFRGLTIRHFRADGLVLEDTGSVVVEHNTLSEIASGDPAHGAINILHNVGGAEISGNHIENTGYAGIIVQNWRTDRRGPVTVRDNELYRTCQKASDCGAIHIDDRSHAGAPAQILHNQIAGFGSAIGRARGIYLDDYLSNALVACNSVSGPGFYGMQLHGGDHVMVRQNYFDMTGLAVPVLYQEEPKENFGMASNIFERNAFPATDWRVQVTGANRGPILRGGRRGSGATPSCTQ